MSHARGYVCGDPNKGTVCVKLQYLQWAKLHLTGAPNPAALVLDLPNILRRVTFTIVMAASGLHAHHVMPIYVVMWVT